MMHLRPCDGPRAPTRRASAHRVGRAAESGLAASGTAGHGDELAPYARPRRARRGGRRSRSPRTRGRATRRRGCTPAAAGCSTPSGCRARGWSAGCATSCRRSSRRARGSCASIWGRSVDDYRARRRAARRRRRAERGRRRGEPVVPEPRGPPGHLRPRSPSSSAEVIAATAGCGRPRWAKLSPNTVGSSRSPAAVHAAGAEAVTLVNTLLGMVIDPETLPPGARHRRRGAVGTRRSSRSRCASCTTCTPPLPSCRSSVSAACATGWDAVEMLLAGASAVQVGTATLRRPAPRAPDRRRARRLGERTGRRPVRLAHGRRAHAAPGAGVAGDGCLMHDSASTPALG